METTNAQLAELYRKDGFLTGIHIADNKEVTHYQQAYNALETEIGPEKCEIGLVDWHFDYQFIWKLAIHPKIVDVIEGLIGPDVMLLATHFFCKYGPREKFVAWHQDVTYWGLEPPDAITAWYAIDDSDTGNGCMAGDPRKPSARYPRTRKISTDRQPVKHQSGSPSYGSGGRDRCRSGVEGGGNVYPPRTDDPRQPTESFHTSAVRSNSSLHCSISEADRRELIETSLETDSTAR